MNTIFSIGTITTFVPVSSPPKKLFGVVDADVPPEVVVELFPELIKALMAKNGHAKIFRNFIMTFFV
mgnify:CR=1 FL=1